MNKSHIGTLIATCCLLARSALADDTNALKTALGVFETRTDTVLIKGFGTAGSLTVGQVVISVRYKESKDTMGGDKANGLAIEIENNTPVRERILIDYEEIDSLLNCITYLNKVNYDVTKLPGFEVSFSTKAGLQLVANSVRRDGAIQEALEYGNDPRILLTTLQMSQLYGLIDQARKSLDAARTDK
jgi:hypothetical protein